MHYCFLTPDDKSWEEIEVTGDKPGYLQDHSMVEYEDKLYVFGGEISFCNDQEIPLWIFDTEVSNRALSTKRILIFFLFQGKNVAERK